MHWIDLDGKALLVSSARTPFCRMGGPLARTPIQNLASHAFQAAMARAGVSPSDIEDVVLGNVVMPAEATNPGRVASLLAGVPPRVPAMTVQRNCASGMEAIGLACERIQRNQAQIVLAGGAENMSLLPLLLPESILPKAMRLAKAKTFGQKLSILASLKLADLKPRPGLKLGLTDAACGEIMGMTAERLAGEWHISREAQDAWALQSHQRAAAAAQRLADQRAAMATDSGWLDVDDGIRENQTAEALGRLRPIFDRRDGSVTVGNTCQVTDGAAATIIMDDKLAQERSCKPIARVLGYAWTGCDPARMGLGPVHAVLELLAAAGMDKDQIATWELNEAFAAQLLACQAAFADHAYCETIGHTAIGAIDESLLNPDGGAIAIGHPVGATGTRLVQAVAQRLAGTDDYGVATLCVGGGQGAAMLLQGCGGVS